jgi:hypothetical protein
MGDADIQKLIKILTDEAPLHKELLKAMINRFKRGGNSVVTVQSENEKHMEAAKAIAIDAFDKFKQNNSEENKLALQSAEGNYYITISDLLEDAPENEKEFQHYILGKLKLSTIEVDTQVAAGSAASAASASASAANEAANNAERDALFENSPAAPASPATASPTVDTSAASVSASAANEAANNAERDALFENSPAASVDTSAASTSPTVDTTASTPPASSATASPTTAPDTTASPTASPTVDTSTAAVDTSTAAVDTSTAAVDTSASPATAPDTTASPATAPDTTASPASPATASPTVDTSTAAVEPQFGNSENDYEPYRRNSAPTSPPETQTTQAKQKGGARHEVTPIGKNLDISLKKRKASKTRSLKKSRRLNKKKKSKTSKKSKKSRKSNA